MHRVRAHRTRCSHRLHRSVLLNQRTAATLCTHVGGHLCCGCCVSSLPARCPRCGEARLDKLIASLSSRAVIVAAMARCPASNCVWVGPLGALDTHWVQCPHARRNGDGERTKGEAAAQRLHAMSADIAALQAKVNDIAADNAALHAKADSLAAANVALHGEVAELRATVRALVVGDTAIRGKMGGISSNNAVMREEVSEMQLSKLPAAIAEAVAALQTGNAKSVCYSGQRTISTPRRCDSRWIQLDLGGKNIGDAGAAYLAKVLASNQALKSVCCKHQGRICWVCCACRVSMWWMCPFGQARVPIGRDFLCLRTARSQR